MSDLNAQNLDANFSTLILSLASSATMSLGLAPNPTTQKVEKDLKLAKFNIDLLLTLQEKTKGNLSEEETQFLDKVINDLKLKFVQNP